MAVLEERMFGIALFKESNESLIKRISCYIGEFYKEYIRYLGNNNSQHPNVKDEVKENIKDLMLRISGYSKGNNDKAFVEVRIENFREKIDPTFGIKDADISWKFRRTVKNVKDLVDKISPK